MSSTNPTSTKSKRSIWQRIGRFLLFFLLVLILLVIIIVSGTLLYFTPARIEKHITPVIAETIQRDFQFSVVRFNLFKGFVFKEISIPPPADSSQIEPLFPIHRFKADKISLGYSLGQILKKKLIINEISIQAPQIELHPQILPPNSLRAEAKPTPQEPEEIHLPIAFDLQKFRLQNAEITVETHNDTIIQYAYLSEINLYLDDLKVPSGNLMQHDSLLQGQLTFKCDHSRFVFKQSSPELELQSQGTLEAALRLTLNSLQHIQFETDMNVFDVLVQQTDSAVSNTFKLDMPVNLDVAGVLDAKAGQARIQPLSLSVDDVSWLTMSMSLDSLFSSPFINGEISASQIPLHQLLRFAHMVLPDTLLPEIYLHNPNAFFSLKDTRINGPFPDSTRKEPLTIHAALELDNFGITLNRGEYILTDFDFHAAADFNVVNTAVPNTSISIEANYDSIAMQPMENQSFYSGPAAFAMNASLNHDFMPTQSTIELEIKNILGAHLQANASVQASDIQNVLANAQIRFDEIQTRQLSANQLDTKLSGKMTLKVETLDSIVAQLDVQTDSIRSNQPGQVLTFAPVQAQIGLHAQTDTSFQQFALHNLTTSVNDFLQGRFAGNVTIAEELDGTFAIRELTLEHNPLYEWLPSAVRQELEGLSLSGFTRLVADGEFNITDHDTTYRAAARLDINNTDVQWPVQNLFVTNLNVQTSASLDSRETGHLDLQAFIDRISTDAADQTLMQNNEIQLHASFPDFNTFSLDSGRIQLPDLKSFATLNATVKHLDSNPTINAYLDITQSAQDTIWLGSDIYYVGENNLLCDVTADTQQAFIKLHLKTTDLTFSIPQVVSVERINADVSLEQNIDIQQGTLIGNSPRVVETPSNSLIDYYLYRNYYFIDAQPKSRINIRKVIAADYLVENINLEAFIGMGQIEIPEFTLDAYGGNIGGKFIISATDQNMQNADYRLSAHFAGINSSLLLPLNRAKSKGNITAHAELAGKGFDLDNGLNLSGFFTITEIESRVADNLLRALDPEDSDPGIRNTRRLINRGFKPRLFSFDVQNGYCYPALYFNQPWYFPIQLSGGAIELGRVPLAFFINAQE